jgi:hypothetical protein
MKIAVIEFSTAHHELFPSYFHLLKNNNLTFFINNSLTCEMEQKLDHTKVQRIRLSKFKIIDAFRLAANLHKNKFTHCLINTAEGKVSKYFCIFNKLFGIKNIGIIHNANKIQNPGFTQRSILKRLDHVLVLSDFIKDSLNEKNVQVFYPVFQFKNSNSRIKNQHQLVISIIGNVEFKRRDYQFLINFLSQHKDKLQDRICFKIIGNASAQEGPLLIKRVEDEKLSSFFQFFNQRLSDDQMNHELDSSDLIFPLITPSIKIFNDYLKYKISGAYNLSYASHIPMIIHDRFSALDDFKHGNYFFSNEKDLLNLLLSLSDNREDISHKAEMVKERAEFLKQRQIEIFDCILSH